MTAATAAPVRPVPGGARSVPLTAARLLRLELRHNAMPWILPLIAALFWFDSYRPSTSQPPFWILRTFWNMGQGHTIIDFGPFVAGVAAWMGSRDGRRRMADLVTGTSRPRWAAQLATWGATAIWAVAAYLAFVGVMFAVYARQGLLGSPPWWSVAVGAVAVTTFSAAGFAVGVCFPSRFAAAPAAFGGFLLLMLSSQTGFSHTSGWAQILPTNSNGNFQLDSGVLYPYLPDLPIARIMFFAGLTVAVVGLLGLPARVGGPWLRRSAAVVAVAGLAAAGTAVGLAGTARLSAHGMVIPALHDAASDRPIPYTPVCDHAAGVPVCLNPAYRKWLPDVTAALRPVLAEVAGLPGAPARTTQIGAVYTAADGGVPGSGVTLSGRPPVLGVPLGALNLPGAFGSTAAELTQQLQLLFVHAFVIPGAGPGTTAQLVVQAALLQGAGTPLGAQPGELTDYGLPSWARATQEALTGGRQSANGAGPVTGPVYTAAKRLTDLPPIGLHAWLAAHLTAVRAGQITLAQLP
jgi:hypothetical protein